jgi:hypothetical protein
MSSKNNANNNNNKNSIRNNNNNNIVNNTNNSIRNNNNVGNNKISNAINNNIVNNQIVNNQSANNQLVNNRNTNIVDVASSNSSQNSSTLSKSIENCKKLLLNSSLIPMLSIKNIIAGSVGTVIPWVILLLIVTFIIII